MAFPTQLSCIERAEAELGRQLPQPLRERLLRENGGELSAEDDDWQLHPVWDDRDRRTMGRTANHIVRETASARQWAGFPVGAVSVADNGSGDRLILRPGSTDIELWDHETRECRSVTLNWEQPG